VLDIGEQKTQRYRDAESRLWRRYGVEPAERFIDLESPRVRLRVLEIGSGEPLVLVHGTGGPGTWPSLVSRLVGVRCLMLERPGWGLSAPVDYAARDYKPLAADLLCGALDALGITRADVLGASIGNTWALAFAARHASRVGRILLMGGGPLRREVPVPTFIRLLASPVGALLVRRPQKPDMIRSQLRRLGHGASLDAGRIPEEFIDWRVAMSRHTAAMRHERDMVRTIVGARGFRPGLTFTDPELARIEQRTLHVFGTADPTGTIDTWTRVAALLPHGELALVEGAGHVPWFDEPTEIAGRIAAFLREPQLTRSR
jgi:2-hydroxy-6-oxonona-2,4-dienedioate hydrolase